VLVSYRRCGVACRSAGQLSGIALRDVTGRYLTAVGRDAVIQARNRAAGKDEIFVAEHSQPQVFFTAHNGRMISTRQGKQQHPLTRVSQYQKGTRSSAIAEGPCDASCQLKSCQLPRNSAETTYMTSPDQIDGMKLEI